MFAPKQRREFRRMLAVADPSELADSVESYLCAMPAQDVRELARRSEKRLAPDERLQFGQYLDEKTLNGEGDPLLARRLVAFLRQYPAAIEALGQDAVEQIAARLDDPQIRRPGTRAMNAGAAALVALALLVALVPLAAQYLHQRGLLAGLTDASPLRANGGAPIRSSLAAVYEKPKRIEHRRSSRPRHVVLRAAPIPKWKRATHARRTAPVRIIARTPHRVRPRTRVSALWKFDRRNYRYFNGRSAGLQERARLAVQSYLNAVIAGNTALALEHLGLPPNADLVNLSEVPIISRTSRARVVRVEPAAGGGTRVDAAIRGRTRNYLEVFHVALDGPALRITNRYYVPVTR